jgi:hypothetical protein
MAMSLISKCLGPGTSTCSKHIKMTSKATPKVIQKSSFGEFFGNLGDLLGARGSTFDAGASFWQPLGTPLATMVAACDMLDSILDVILEQTSIHSGIRFK